MQRPSPPDLHLGLCEPSFLLPSSVLMPVSAAAADPRVRQLGSPHRQPVSRAACRPGTRIWSSGVSLTSPSGLRQRLDLTVIRASPAPNRTLAPVVLVTCLFAFPESGTFCSISGPISGSDCAIAGSDDCGDFDFAFGPSGNGMIDAGVRIGQWVSDYVTIGTRNVRVVIYVPIDPESGCDCDDPRHLVVDLSVDPVLLDPPVSPIGLRLLPHRSSERLEPLFPPPVIRWDG